MWVAAGIGMAIGSGLYIIGIGAAVALFLLLQFLRPEWLRGSGLAREAADDELEDA